MKNDNIRRGLIVGRYQMFHNGHLNTIKYMDEQDDIDEIIIGIGSSQYDRNNKSWEMPWITNPFTYEEREEMIIEALKGKIKKPVKIVGIQDQHNIVRWVDYIIHKLPQFHMYFTNTRSEIEHFLKKGQQIRNIPVTGSFHAQTIREMIAIGEDWKEYVPEGVYRYINKINGSEILRELFQEHSNEIIEAHNFFPDMEWRTFDKLSEMDKKKIRELKVVSEKSHIDDYFIHPSRTDINIKLRSGILKIKNDLNYENGLEKTATYSYKFPIKSKALDTVLKEIKLAPINGSNNSEYVDEESFAKHLSDTLGFSHLQIYKSREIRFHDSCAIDYQKIKLLNPNASELSNISETTSISELPGKEYETIGLESRSRQRLLESLSYLELEKYNPMRYADFLSSMYTKYDKSIPKGRSKA